MLFKRNEPLAPFTTFGIGGPARWFVEVTSEDEVVEATAWAREKGLDLLILGGGSNLLVSDAGFNGLVLRVGLRGIEVAPARSQDSRSKRSPEKDVPGIEITENFSSGDGKAQAQIYKVAAGESWDRFVERVVEANCIL